MSYYNDHYAYAVGRIRVLETALLKSTDVERMLGAPNARSAYQVLNDLDYANHIGDINNLNNFREVINAGLREVQELLVRINPHPEVLDILWLYYDFHNIRTLIRAFKHPIAESDLEQNYLSHTGSYSHNLIQKYIFRKEYGEKLDPKLKMVIDIANHNYQENDDALDLDIYLDKEYFRLSRQITKNIRNQFVTDFLISMIDILNIKTFLRCKKFYQDKPELIEKALIDGGLLPVKEFINLFDKDDQALVDFCQITPYNEAVTKGLSYYNKKRSFMELNKLLENALIKYLVQAKRVALGPEPLISYFWAKKNNSQIINTIMIGKLNQIPENQIREKLVDLYI